MLLNELFSEEEITEDLRKTLGAAAIGGALLLTPLAKGNNNHNDFIERGAASQDVAILAQTIWGEARGHGAEGMNAVAHVIKNRIDANKRKFGIGLRNVITKDKQFSCWNRGDPNNIKMQDMLKIAHAIRDQKIPEGHELEDDTGNPINDFGTWYEMFKKTGSYRDYVAWKQAFKIADNILTKNTPDPTNGATYYHTTAVHPYWAKDESGNKIKPSSQIANHLFYRM